MADNFPAPQDPALARKKKWDRITLVVVILMLAAAALGLIFLQHVRANFWAWRLTWKPDAETRGRLIASIASLGDEAATGPALRLTRDQRPEVRLAGQEILLQLIEHKQRERARRLQDEIARSNGDIDKLPEELRRPLQTDPAVVARFREMLADPWPEAQTNAITGVLLTRDAAAAEQLQSLAVKSTQTAVATLAVEALGRVAGGPALEDAMRRVLGQAADASARAHAIEQLGQPAEDGPWAFRNSTTIAALAGALDDDRPVASPPTSPRFDIRRMLARQGMLPPRRSATTAPAGQRTILPPPTTEPDDEQQPATVADYAARMLGAMLDRPLGLPSRAAAGEREGLLAAYRQAAADWTPGRN